MKNDIPHPDFPVIDAHVHLYPDALAPKVVPMLSKRFGNPPLTDKERRAVCRETACELFGLTSGPKL